MAYMVSYDVSATSGASTGQATQLALAVVATFKTEHT
jgi:hypothetical protein